MEDGPEKALFAFFQKKWFYKTVENSDAIFKVLITSSPILGPDKENKNDNLSNEEYSYEQGEILDFIKNQKNLFIVGTTAPRILYHLLVSQGYCLMSSYRSLKILLISRSCYCLAR